MDAAGQRRTAIFEKLEEYNSFINKQRQKGTVAAQIKSLSQQGDSTIMPRALFALHLCHKSHSFQSIQCPILADFFSLNRINSSRVLGNSTQMSALIRLLHEYTLEFQRETKCISSGAFTCDSWTDNCQEPNIGFTAHYLTPNMDLTSKVFEVFPYDASQTAEHQFAHFWKRVQKHFAGDTLIHSFTTDNGANYVAAMKLLLEK
jgi:hypothetical protein